MTVVLNIDFGNLVKPMEVAAKGEEKGRYQARHENKQGGLFGPGKKIGKVRGKGEATGKSQSSNSSDRQVVGNRGRDIGKFGDEGKN